MVETERITADNPNLAVNIITQALENNPGRSAKTLAVVIIRGLHDSGLKIVPREGESDGRLQAR